MDNKIMSYHEYKHIRSQVSRDLHNNIVKLDKWVKSALKDCDSPYAMYDFYYNFHNSSGVALLVVDDIKRTLEGNFGSPFEHDKEKITTCEYCKTEFKGLFAKQRYDNHIQDRHKRENEFNNIAYVGLAMGIMGGLLSSFRFGTKTHFWNKIFKKGSK